MQLGEKLGILTTEKDLGLRLSLLLLFARSSRRAGTLGQRICQPMSEYTFNIADYRRQSPARARDNRSQIAERRFVDMTAPQGSGRRSSLELIRVRPNAAASVADIRSFRESRWTHRYSTRSIACSKGSKLICFGHQAESARVQPIRYGGSPAEARKQSGPGELPPAA